MLEICCTKVEQEIMKLRKTQANKEKLEEFIRSARQQFGSDLEYLDATFDKADFYVDQHKDRLEKVIPITYFKNKFNRKNGKAAFARIYTRYADLFLADEVFEDLHEQGFLTISTNVEMKYLVEEADYVDSTFANIYHLSKDQLAKVATSEEGKVVTGTWDNIRLQNAIAQLYEVPMHSLTERNTLIRPAWWWDLLEKRVPNHRIAVYYDRVGLPRGYMLYYHTDHEIVVTEIYSMAEDGYKALIANFNDSEQNFDEFRIEVSEDIDLSSCLANIADLKVENKPYLMTKIIDFAKLVETLSIEKTGTYYLEVTDDSLCTWNRGIWEVKRTPKNCVVKESDQAPDYSASIAVWAKVILGNLTVSQAIEQGLIKRHTDKNLNFFKGNVTFLDKP